jgi:hypothetical protein
MARFPPRVSTITASFTDTGDVDIYLVDASAGAVTLTLRSPSRRRKVEVVKTDSSSNAVTVATSGDSATIVGVTSLPKQYDAAGYAANGLAGSSAVWYATAVSTANAMTLSGVTAGTVAASKALVVDSNKDLSALRNVTATNYDAGASGTAGTVDIFPTTASKGKNAFTAAANAGDTTNTVTNAAQAGARTFTIPDPGASANFDLTAVEAEANNGAIGIKSGIAMLTKAGVAAMTLAAPTATTDDGKVLRIVAATANAHTVTQSSPGFNGAGGSGDVATFGGAIGDNLVIVAYQGVWHIVSKVNVTVA